jgi:Asp-tRNA(Asn)/Glu-tRNA(Gln) amidotransferase A subunit family amidase
LFISESLRNGEYTAVNVLHAYQQAAITAHQRTNCLTRMIIDADTWAMQLDQLATDDGYVKPALFGLPVSIKESLSVSGSFQLIHAIG